jgi:hypothetical protein
VNRGFTWALLMLALVLYSARDYAPWSDAWCEKVWSVDSTFFASDWRETGR